MGRSIVAKFCLMTLASILMGNFILVYFLIYPKEELQEIDKSFVMLNNLKPRIPIKKVQLTDEEQTIPLKAIKHINKSTKPSKEFIREMRKLHAKVNTMSDIEITEYFNREKISDTLFKNTLNIEKDRNLLSRLFPNLYETNDRVTDQLRLKLNVTEDKTILVWSLDGNLRDEHLIQQQCNIKNCAFTFDKSKANISDAIIFHKSIFTSKLPPTLNPKQVRVFYRIESPVYSEHISDEKNSKTNWSASYRRDSVLNTPYERFTPFLNVQNLPKKPLRNYAKSKYKLIAWYVSNCYAHNGRMNFVLELQKHVEVDIYGQCGNYLCDRGREECTDILKNDYKFYLSFENCNCKDYVTEKLFWNALQNDVVPVVMGAHPDEYKRIAPPRSYIHVDMFKSPKQLAEYLKFLNENDELYNSYFLWKNTGEFIDSKFICRLCAMVHLAPHFPMWYNDVNAWWGSGCDQYLNYDGYSSWKNHKKNLNTNISYGYKRTSK